MKDFFDLLYNQSVTPNGLLALQMTHSGIAYNNYINVIMEQRRLLLSGHLLETSTPAEFEGLPATKTISLTDKGLHLLREAELAMARQPKAAKLKAIPFEAWQEQIKLYLSQFPAGNQGSAPIRSPRDRAVRVRSSGNW